MRREEVSAETRKPAADKSFCSSINLEDLTLQLLHVITSVFQLSASSLIYAIFHLQFLTRRSAASQFVCRDKSQRRKKNHLFKLISFLFEKCL